MVSLVFGSIEQEIKIIFFKSLRNLIANPRLKTLYENDFLKDNCLLKHTRLKLCTVQFRNEKSQKDHRYHIATRP